MKTVLLILIFLQTSFAALTTHQSDQLIIIDGKLEIGSKGLGVIHSGTRRILVSRENLWASNKTDPYTLKRRETFKVKLGDIVDVQSAQEGK